MHIWCQPDTHRGKYFNFYNNLSMLNKIKKVRLLIAYPGLIYNLQLMKVLGF